MELVRSDLPCQNIQTVVGVKDAANTKALIVYPDGTVQHRFPDWRLVFCISDPPRFMRELEPTQKLSKGHLPIVITHVEHGEVGYEVTSFAWAANGRIVNFTKVRIVNKGSGSKDVSFWFGLEGFTHTMEKMLKGHEKIIKFTDDHIILDGFLIMTFRPSPDASNLTYPPAKTVEQTVAKLAEEMRREDPSNWEGRILEAEARLRTNCLELAGKYQLKLDPNDEKTIWIMLPTDNIGEDKAMKILSSISPEDCLRECLEFWQSFLSKGMKISVPDKEVTDFYKASLAYILIFREKADCNYIVKPGATIYDQFWYRDAEGITRAFDIAGYHKEAEESLEYFIYLKSHPEEKWAFYQAYYAEQYRPLEPWFQSQDLPCTDSPLDDRGVFPYPFEPEKCFDCPNGQYDGQGQALKALVRHYKITGDRAWLERVYPHIRLGVEWIRNGRKLTRVMIEGHKPAYYGLVPKGHQEAVSIYPAWDHNFGDNLAVLDGLPYAIEAASILGREDDVAWMQTEYEDFKKCIGESLETSLITKGDRAGYPPTPYKSGVWRKGFSTLLSLFTCGLFDPTSETCTRTLRTLEKNQIKEGRIISGIPSLPTPWMNTMLKRITRPLPGYPLERGRNARALLDLLPTPLFKSEGTSSSGYNASNYSGRLWEIYVMRKEYDKAIDVFRKWIDHAYKPTRAWIENVRMPERIGLGDMPHGWIAALYVMVVRNMLITEHGDELHIVECIPREWTMDERGTTVKDAPTDFGMASFTIQGDTSSNEVGIKLSVAEQQGKPSARNVVIHVRHPSGSAISRVMVDGKSWKRFDASTVTVPPSSERIKVIFPHNSHTK